jgi:hypothetical protein
MTMHRVRPRGQPLKQEPIEEILMKKKKTDLLGQEAALEVANTGNFDPKQIYSFINITKFHNFHYLH